MAGEDRIFIGGGGANYADPQNLILKYANRHGLIAGATGTGKTVTLQILAESFSRHGVSVFLSDVKGDLSGLAHAGSPDFKLHEAFVERANTIGFDDYDYDAFPVVFWDLFGDQGHPIRTTISELGPLLLSRLMELTDVQEGVLNIAFRIADEDGLPLLDLKDLQSLLIWLGEHSSEISLRYGNVSTASVGAIQRRLLVLENQGAAEFFGEPAVQLMDMISHTPGGQGRINILAADKLMQSPRLYATFLLWMLSELFENLPEVGDLDKPKLVFFFDEAHLLFDDSPKALINKVEQVARLIRSKGVGVYFVTQSPDDVPDDILGQLGNRVQHALRAFTPRDAKALKLAAQTFRTNPRFDTAEAIRDCGVGEALVSTLEKKGIPSVVERTLIRPPSSQLGPVTQEERAVLMAKSHLSGVYDLTVDRQSAFEMLARRAQEAATQAARAQEKAEKKKKSDKKADLNDDFLELRRFDGEGYSKSRSKSSSGKSSSRKSSQSSSRSRSSRSDSIGEAFAKSLARSLGSKAGQSIIRGVLGSLFKGR